MPAQPPGFYGKIPAAGDFVSRRLAADFVRFWDRWVVRHLVARLAQRPLCFLLSGPSPGPVLGMVLASHDRAGRRFPLTLAASPPVATTLLPVAAAAWLAALAEAGRDATLGAVDASGLDARLLALPPPPEAGGPPAPRLLLWTGDREPLPADPEAPGPVLDALL